MVPPVLTYSTFSTPALAAAFMMWRVPSTLGRMMACSGSVAHMRKPAAVWYTRPQPSTARATSAGSRMSPYTTWTSRPSSGAGSALARIMARTGAPRCTSRRQMLLPTWPLAPVTRVGRMRTSRARFSPDIGPVARDTQAFSRLQLDAGEAGQRLDVRRMRKERVRDHGGESHAPGRQQRPRIAEEGVQIAADGDQAARRGGGDGSQDGLVEAASWGVDDHHVGVAHGGCVIRGGTACTTALERSASGRAARPKASPSSAGGAISLKTTLSTRDRRPSPTAPQPAWNSSTRAVRDPARHL